MLQPRTLIGATFFFNHRPLERSQRPEGMGKPAVEAWGRFVLLPEKPRIDITDKIERVFILIKRS